MARRTALHASLGGEGEVAWFQPSRMTIKATAEDTGCAAYGLIESHVRAGASTRMRGC